MKQLIKNYTFNATSKTITLTDFTTVLLERLQLVTDVTSNAILYNFADASVATATVAGNVITLSTIGPAASTDKLAIVYDDAVGDPIYDLPQFGSGNLSLGPTSISAANGDLVASTNVAPYSFAYVTLSGTAGNTVSFQGSVDAAFTNPIAIPSLQLATGQPAAATSTTAVGVTWLVPLFQNYLRVRITNYVSGTVTASTKISTIPIPMMSTTAFVTQSGTWQYLINATSNGTTGDVGTKTTSFAGATQTLSNYNGGMITVLCGTVSGASPTLSAQLQWSPDGGTTWLNLGPASGNVTATGNTITFMVYPTNFSVAGATPAALTTGATQTVQINAQLPRTWRLYYTIGGTTP